MYIWAIGNEDINVPLGFSNKAIFLVRRLILHEKNIYCCWDVNQLTNAKIKSKQDPL